MPSANIWSVDVHIFNNVGGKKERFFSPREHVGVLVFRGQPDAFFTGHEPQPKRGLEMMDGKMFVCLFVFVAQGENSKARLEKFWKRNVIRILDSAWNKALFNLCWAPTQQTCDGEDNDVLLCRGGGGQSACQLGAGTLKVFLAMYTKQWLVISLYELRWSSTAEGHSFVLCLENNI